MEVETPIIWIKRKELRRIKKMSVMEQSELGARKTRVFAESLKAMENFKRVHKCCPKVPALCLVGFVKSLYPPGKEFILREGPQQGYKETQMIEYVMKTFYTACRVDPEGQLFFMRLGRTSSAVRILH